MRRSVWATTVWEKEAEDVMAMGVGKVQNMRDHKLALKIQQEEMARSYNRPPAYDADPSKRSRYKEDDLYPSLGDYSDLGFESDKKRRSSYFYPNVHKSKMAPPSSHPKSKRYFSQSEKESSSVLSHYRYPGSIGIQRAEIRHGIRPVVLCKNEFGKLGLRIKAVFKGVFVAFVSKDSPAAMAGIRFGDQILQVNGHTLAGLTTDSVMKFLEKSDPSRVEIAVRDRPFQRTVTLQKDSGGHVGFIFKKGRVAALIKNSSAARNGLLVGEHLCEINGQCVVGMKDQNVEEIILNCGRAVTLTLMPSHVFLNVLKNMGGGLMKKQDHSIPDI